jgi:hypothetical protein
MVTRERMKQLPWPSDAYGPPAKSSRRTEPAYPSGNCQSEAHNRSRPGRRIRSGRDSVCAVTHVTGFQVCPLSYAA